MYVVVDVKVHVVLEQYSGCIVYVYKYSGHRVIVALSGVMSSLM